MRGAAALVGAGLLVLSGCLGAPNPGTCVPLTSATSDHDARTVHLTWEPVAGAEFYQVNRTVDGGEDTVQALLPGDATSYEETDVPEGIVSYRVAADGHPTGCDGADFHFGGHFEPPSVECAAGLEVLALEDESVLLTWEPVPEASGYDVLRGEAGGALLPYAVVGGDAVAFLDLGTTAGTAYAYAVAANGLPEEGMACEVVEVTAVPFLGGPLPWVLAGLGTLAAAALVGRRK